MTPKEQHPDEQDKTWFPEYYVSAVRHAGEGPFKVMHSRGQGDPMEVASCESRGVAIHIARLLDDSAKSLWSARQPSQGAAEAVAILMELVSLKNLKEWLDSQSPQNRDTIAYRAADDSYCRRKPLAWQHARAFLAAQPSGAGEGQPNTAYATVLMAAAAKSGDEGAIRLAAQLAGCAPCDKCGYVNFKCRCAAKPAAEQAGPNPVAWRWQYDDGEWSQWHRIENMPAPMPKRVEYAFSHPADARGQVPQDARDALRQARSIVNGEGDGTYDEAWCCLSRILLAFPDAAPPVPVQP